MRKLLFILILLILPLVACNRNQGGSAIAPSGDTTAAEAPRVEVTPTPTLPATWTPASLVRGGHLYLLPVAGVEGTRIVHIVQPGETLAELSARYNISMETLARINDISDRDHIEAGSVLIVPRSGN
jgi:nucleoid-associated protein YgaU